ncbi:UDP-3-O-acyl-N-acetylglucosamine deacetylase [Yersinia canariae]|uniref:UDP-3-O-acyl-N-acetylglucosamine deacetylase n=1 Tax=Yersinia canariae TaxID=2607663 RepID=A0A857F145_9GAMM|nr:UDP-3-O-acyl-N-acetylglucosamine deacetylase [Yersinia canariae]QHB33071.1 UDP-3-O-acyl-N-acetylglucosamine deacetylase [Yersinia canariae]
MMRQKTIQKAVQMCGVGLHSGRKVNMRLLPADSNTGIVFRRVDLSPVVDIPLCAKRVNDTVLATSIFNADGIRVSTVEHLLSAISGLGIDNLVIEIDAPEIPIVDGSANPFTFMLLSCAGLVKQKAAKKIFKIKEMVRVTDGDKWAMLEPANYLSLDFSIDFQHPIIVSSDQRFSITLTPETYVSELSRARTFGFIKDIEYLQKKGLCLGASLDNAIGLDEYRVVNEEGLRYRNEFVRHKILDAIGDLFVCGHSILGAFTAYKSGHALNNKLINTVLERSTAWELMTFEDENLNPNFSTPLLV